MAHICYVTKIQKSIICSVTGFVKPYISNRKSRRRSPSRKACQEDRYMRHANNVEIPKTIVIFEIVQMGVIYLGENATDVQREAKRCKCVNVFHSTFWCCTLLGKFRNLYKPFFSCSSDKYLFRSLAQFKFTCAWTTNFFSAISYLWRVWLVNLKIRYKWMHSCDSWLPRSTT